jgi:predicted RNase H-like HicB family nuclease
MKTNNHYPKIVEWSEEDQCYIGSCPGLMYGGCHGDNEVKVFKQLCKIVDEWIEIYKRDNLELPKPVSLESIHHMAA